jgi:hypothetical protein
MQPGGFLPTGQAPVTFRYFRRDVCALSTVPRATTPGKRVDARRYPATFELLTKRLEWHGTWIRYADIPSAESYRLFQVFLVGMPLGVVRATLPSADSPSRYLRKQGRWQTLSRRAATPISASPVLPRCECSSRAAHTTRPGDDRLLASAHESGEPQMCAMAFSPVALLRHAQHRRREPRALLEELDAMPGIAGGRITPPPAPAHHAASRACSHRLPRASSPRPPDAEGRHPLSMRKRESAG